MKKLEIILWNFKELFIKSNYRRDKKTILFGAWFGSKFSDNPRFLFQFLSQNKEQLGLNHVVWVTRNEGVFEELKNYGYEVYMMDSPESLYYHRISGVHILCNGSNDDLQNPHADLLGRYSVGAIKINLWHGICGIKGFGFSSNEYLKMKADHPFTAKIKEFVHKNTFLRRTFACFGGWGDCYFLSTTAEITQYFISATLFPRNNFIESGYPRNYTEGYALKSELSLIDKLQKYSVKILYLPTFREKTDSFTHPLEYAEVIDWLEANNAVWIEKSHDADKSHMGMKKRNSENIINLEKTFEINVLIKEMDLLITDYSSVMYEAVFAGIPILYYVPDYEYYRNSDRGFMQSAEEFMVGFRVENGNELLDKLNIVISNPGDLYGQNYKTVMKRAWGKCDGIEQIWHDICLKCGIN